MIKVSQTKDGHSCYEYDVNEEKITDIVEEGKNRIAVHTYREVPLRQKKQYIFLYSVIFLKLSPLTVLIKKY